MTGKGMYANAIKNNKGFNIRGILTLEPMFDEYNRIKGIQLRMEKDGETMYYPFKNPDEKTTIFSSLYTNQAYSIFEKLLLLEVEFTRLFADQEELIPEN